MSSLYYPRVCPRSMTRSILVLLAALAGCAPTHSGLTIPPGQRFSLGGDGDGSFRVEICNRGAAPVMLGEVRHDGQTIDLGVLEPGASRAVQFGAGSAALLTNRTNVEARVAAVVRGLGELTMQTVEDG